jgi:hypothetical protein
MWGFDYLLKIGSNMMSLVFRLGFEEIDDTAG